MPQIDYSTFISQIFWLIIVFAAIYFVLHNFYIPKVRDIVKKRAMDLNQCIADSEDLERSVKELNALIANQNNAIKKRVAETKSAARNKAEKLFEEISSNNREYLANLHSEHDKELNKMISLLESEVTSISAQVSEEILVYLKKMYNYNFKL